MALDNRDIQAIADAKSDRHLFNCQTEAFKLFSEVVDEAHQWLTSCPCHNHIWSRKEWSRWRQQQEFQRETGCKRCWRRGRRGSELARGDFDFVIEQALVKNSVRFQSLLALVEPARATRLVHTLEKMKRAWVEEVLDKVMGWKRLPWLLLGLWPEDERSQQVATECLSQWNQLENKDEADRVTKAFMNDSDGENQLFEDLKRLDETGEASTGLMLRLKEYDLLMTHCQRVEQIHAEYKRGFEAGMQCATLCANLNLCSNLQLFECWEAREFAKMMWNCHAASRLLKGCPVSSAIAVHAPQHQKNAAVYHALPVQLFRTISEAHVLLQRWEEAQVKVTTQLPTQEKMLMDSFFRRLEDRVVSMTAPIVRAQGGVESAVAACYDRRSVVDMAMVAAQQPISYQIFSTDHKAIY